MCQSFSRCIAACLAACLAIAAPDLADGAAIFFALWGRDRSGRIHSEPQVSHAGTGTRGLMIQGVSREAVGLWRLRGGGTEPSSLFVCPQRRLFRGNSSAVKFGKAQLPFVHQLCSLSRAALGTGKHPFCMDALLRRFAQRLAGGMIGNTTPDAHGKSVQNGFYTSWVGCRERGLPLRAGARLNWG